MLFSSLLLIFSLVLVAVTASPPPPSGQPPLFDVSSSDEELIESTAGRENPDERDTVADRPEVHAAAGPSDADDGIKVEAFFSQDGERSPPPPMPMDSIWAVQVCLILLLLI